MSAASLTPADFKFLVKSSSLEMDKFKLILRSKKALIGKELSPTAILMGASFRHRLSSPKNVFILNCRSGKESIFIPNPLGCPRGVMVKAMNCGIVVREFVLQSRYYVHFRANTLGKGMNPLYSPSSYG